MIPEDGKCKYYAELTWLNDLHTILIIDEGGNVIDFIEDDNDEDAIRRAEARYGKITLAEDEPK